MPFPYTPVMAVKARIIRLATLEPGDRIPGSAALSVSRRTRAALVPIGFSDAHHLLRLAGGSLLVRGQEVPILGTPFMSGLLADVSSVPDVQPGDEVVLLGSQGGATLPAEALAERSGLPPAAIPLLGPRVPRHYRTVPGATAEPETARAPHRETAPA
ncbi:alanine racemase C-terminal domain-containing protein [Azospirillum canadense]|uniref:alanine racemase C-terminal domain-containing protein n=1 Tax=Azospirillum canadense TaxID=403962 RepID=UPI002227C755|nr:alanine racemase C-terminal domain-containing protein [Azospirillum canadense]MCW2238955.1 alanine racemase [Azospirillum canadense]